MVWNGTEITLKKTGINDVDALLYFSAFKE